MRQPLHRAGRGDRRHRRRDGHGNLRQPLRRHRRLRRHLQRRRGSYRRHRHRDHRDDRRHHRVLDGDRHRDGDRHPGADRRRDGRRPGEAACCLGSRRGADLRRDGDHRGLRRDADRRDLQRVEAQGARQAAGRRTGCCRRAGSAARAWVHPAWVQRVPGAGRGWDATTARPGRQPPEAVRQRASEAPQVRPGPRERREPLGLPVPVLVGAAALPGAQASARVADPAQTAWPANRWPPGCLLCPVPACCRRTTHGDGGPQGPPPSRTLT